MTDYTARTVDGIPIVVSDGTRWGVAQWILIVALIIAAIVLGEIALVYSGWAAIFLWILVVVGLIFASFGAIVGVFAYPCYEITTRARIGYLAIVRRNISSPEQERCAVCAAIDAAEEAIHKYNQQNAENVAALKAVSDCQRNR